MLAAKAFFETPVAQLTPAMEQEFFTSLMTKNRTYKTTFHQRFADTNPRLLQQLRHEGRAKARILDIGISSGVSTAELYDDLAGGGLEVSIVATDLVIDALLVRVMPKCHALVEPDGFPLRFDLPFGTMKPWVIADDYRNGFFVLRKSINVAFTHWSRRILSNPNDRRITPVKLITPRLLANGNIVVCNDDISHYNDSFAGGFDFIRAANILNRGYFPPAVLADMLANIRRYLSGPSGILLVVRTHEDNSNHGTFFRLRDDQRFEVTGRVGAGSEIEDIVLQAATPC